MLLQDHDPHHIAPDFNTIYYFLALAPILVTLLLFAAWRIMNYLENRKAEEPPGKNNRSGEPEEKNG